MRTIITTERLSLRPFEQRDARRVAYLAGDYDVARMCGRVPHPYSFQAATEWVDRCKTSHAEGVEYAFAVTAELDGLIGSCGVMRPAGADHERAHDGVWELGYWFGRPYWGAGYATEAARAVMEWAICELGARGFAAGHFADNPGSGKVLRKLGFAPTGPEELFGLARQRVSPAERYVWPADAAPVRLADHARSHGVHAAHAPH